MKEGRFPVAMNIQRERRKRCHIIQTTELKPIKENDDSNDILSIDKSMNVYSFQSLGRNSMRSDKNEKKRGSYSTFFKALNSVWCSECGDVISITQGIEHVSDHSDDSNFLFSNFNNKVRMMPTICIKCELKKQENKNKLEKIVQALNINANMQS